jgi:hypothetical protein
VKNIEVTGFCEEANGIGILRLVIGGGFEAYTNRVE